MSIIESPVICSLVSSHWPQPRHPTIIQRVKEAALRTYSGIGDRSIVVSVFPYPFHPVRVKQYGVYLPALLVAVVEKELRRRRLGIPIKHGPLLRMRGGGGVEGGDGVVALFVSRGRVNPNHHRHIVDGWQSIVRIEPKRQDEPIGRIPRYGQ